MTLFEDAAWPSAPKRPRRPTSAGRVTLFGIVLALAAAVTLGITFLPSLTALVGYSMSPALTQVADRIGFTEQGRALFVSTRPELLSDQAFSKACETTSSDSGGSTVGCFYGMEGTAGRIAVFQPADARLADQVAVAAAHEFLHAAYAALPAQTFDPLNALLDARWAQVPADDPLQDQLAGSTGGSPDARPTEEFAYLGSQVGDLGPELESYYAPYFTDRQAVVALEAADRALWSGLDSEYLAKSDALSAAQQAYADSAAQIDADRAQLAADRTAYDQNAAQYNALSPEQRARSYTADDAQEPYGDYLARTLADFGTRDADLATRSAQLAADDVSLTALEAEVQQLYDDYDSLVLASTPQA